MNEILEVNHVSRDFSHGLFRSGSVRAVDDVSFSLERGRTLGLVGNSGCGKTTLLRMITRLIRPTEGQIRWNGQDISDLRGDALRNYHRRIQMVFQNPEASFDPSMRLRDSLIEAMIIHRIGGSRDERMEQIVQTLQQVGLPAFLLDRYPHQISGGEGQRLVICRCLLLKPEILLLDEPTSMLDVSVQAHIMNILRDLQQTLGLTYLYITHDLELLSWISHRIGVMRQGRLLELGDRDQIMEHPQHEYTRSLIQSFHDWGDP